ncbi:MAG: class I SAM-dependent methyltransferase [Lachnospiraceae bacterium]|nr:class I SAM-dependent methyltransferase [Lachnospiraceae bacterium]
MEMYKDFASVYDDLMDNVPYEEWVAHVTDILNEYGIDNGLVLDLGCGTGNVTRLLAEEGYDMIGIDLSEDMLSVAMSKEEVSCREGENILYLCQDMREFELYGTVRAVVSLCDSINYLLTKEDIITVCRLVNNYLDPEGIFVFDFNTVCKYRAIGDSVIAENRDDCSFIWENYYDEETHINEYELTLFMKEEAGKDPDVYRKSVEEHIQKGYSVNEMKDYIEKSGLIPLKMFDADTLKEADDKSERVLVIAKENVKL